MKAGDLSKDHKSRPITDLKVSIRNIQSLNWILNDLGTKFVFNRPEVHIIAFKPLFGISFEVSLRSGDI